MVTCRSAKHLNNCAIAKQKTGYNLNRSLDRIIELPVLDGLTLANAASNIIYDMAELMSIDVSIYKVH